jgi:hypothetical protein
LRTTTYSDPFPSRAIGLGSVIGRAKVVRDLSDMYQDQDIYDSIDPATWSSVFLIERDGLFFVIYSPPLRKHGYRVTMFVSNRDGDLLQNPPPLQFNSAKIALYWLGIGYNDPEETKYLTELPMSSPRQEPNYAYPLISKLTQIPMLSIKKDEKLGAIKRRLTIEFYTTKSDDYGNVTDESHTYVINITGKQVKIDSIDELRINKTYSSPTIYPSIANEFAEMIRVVCEYADTAKHEDSYSYYTVDAKKSRHY